MHHFSGIKDPRLNRQKKHQLQNVFFVSICAKIFKANNYLLLNDLA
ncbi:MAG: transposase family protein [Methylobacter sp.]